MQLLEDAGLTGTFDFVYAPVDFRDGLACGYGFCNFVDEENAMAAFQRLHAACPESLAVQGQLEVVWSENNQGLCSLVERYRNSPMMHPEIPDDWKPLLLANSQPIPFPAPTRKLKAVRRAMQR